MSDAENQDVAVEEAVEAVVEPEAENSVQEEAKVEPPKEDSQEKNWRETRATLKEQQREIRGLKERLEQREAPREAPRKEEDDYSEISRLSKDDLLTVSQAEKLAGFQARKMIDEALRKKDASQVEERLRLKYTDFDEVLSEDNVEYLIKNEPTLVKSIQNNPDPFVQAEAAYRLAKKFCPGDTMEAKINEKKIEENQKKPLSSNAVKKSGALDQAHMYTNDRVLNPDGRSHYFQQMKEAQRRR